MHFVTACVLSKRSIKQAPTPSLAPTLSRRAYDPSVRTIHPKDRSASSHVPLLYYQPEERLNDRLIKRACFLAHTLSLRAYYPKGSIKQAPTRPHCPKEVVAMRRVIITKKLLRQCMLDSVSDDLEGRVLHKLVMNCLRKRRVSKSRKIGCRARRWHQRKSWDNFSADLTERQFR